MNIPLKENNKPASPGLYAWQYRLSEHAQISSVVMQEGELKIAIGPQCYFALRLMLPSVIWSDKLTFSTNSDEPQP